MISEVEQERRKGTFMHPYFLSFVYLHTTLNALSTQTPRGQELLRHIKKERQIKMMAVFFFIGHDRVLNFMHNPKLAHILVRY